MKSTLGWHQYQKPAFEPQALYVPSRTMEWGNSDYGYITLTAANADLPETMRPLEFDKMKPPCDLNLAARLYRTGFLAMLLNEDGTPKLRSEQALEGAAESERRERRAENRSEAQNTMAARIESESDGDGAVCPKCGKQFRSRNVPHFHTMHCGKMAA